MSNLGFEGTIALSNNLTKLECLMAYNNTQIKQGWCFFGRLPNINQLDARIDSPMQGKLGWLTGLP